MKLRIHSQGFTLIEAILVIAIIGVLAAIVAVFIRAPILGYRDTVDRAEITDQADLALRRMARDIRLALPNSVRVNANGSALEFLQTRTGGRYLSADEAMGAAGMNALVFDDPAQAATASVPFTVIAPPATFRQVVAGDSVVVLNLGEGLAPADAYAGGNIARIDRNPAFTADGQFATVTLARPPFGLQSPSMPSPNNSFHVVSGPVSFYCAAQPDGTLALWRAWNYPITATQQAVPAGASRAVVASRLTSCNNLFSYGSAATQRSALVLLQLELQGRYSASAAVRLVHQVHVDNTP